MLAASDLRPRRGDRLECNVVRLDRLVVVSLALYSNRSRLSCQTSYAMYSRQIDAIRKQTSNTVWPANGCQGYSANISQIVNGIISPAMMVLTINVRETVITIFSCA